MMQFLFTVPHSSYTLGPDLLLPLHVPTLVDGFARVLLTQGLFWFWQSQSSALLHTSLLKKHWFIHKSIL